MTIQAMERKLEEGKQELINFLQLFSRQAVEFYKTSRSEALSNQRALKENGRATSVAGGHLNPSAAANELLGRGYDQRLSRELKANQALTQQLRKPQEPPRGPSVGGPSSP